MSCQIIPFVNCAQLLTGPFAVLLALPPAAVFGGQPTLSFSPLRPSLEPLIHEKKFHCNLTWSPDRSFHQASQFSSQHQRTGDTYSAAPPPPLAIECINNNAFVAQTLLSECQLECGKSTCKLTRVFGYCESVGSLTATTLPWIATSSLVLGSIWSLPVAIINQSWMIAVAMSVHPLVFLSLHR